MCTREMTLGEEIINLTKRGIDVPTVERMYRKYIDLDEKGKSEGCYAIDLGPLFPTFDIGDTVRYCRADVEATLNLFRGVGIAGMVTTTVMAVRATPKAIQLLDEEKRRQHANKLEPMDVVKTAWKSDIDKLKKAENELNRQMRDEMYISLNDFYYEVGLEPIKLGDDLGWNIDNGYIDLRFSSQLATDGTPCLVIDYGYGPRYDFRGLM